MSFPRILEIPRIWRHFEELLKFLEKFLVRPPIKLYFPDTKSKIFARIVFGPPLYISYAPNKKSNILTNIFDKLIFLMPPLLELYSPEWKIEILAKIFQSLIFVKNFTCYVLLYFVFLVQSRKFCCQILLEFWDINFLFKFLYFRKIKY